jgi:hypothetical protein
MDLIDLMIASQGAVLQKASSALRRSHLAHYEAAGPAETERHLKELYRLVLECIARRDLGGICRYAETVAHERFESGFGIGEVQTAFNALEEAIWQVVISKIASEDLAEAAGLIGTVLGAGKDALARTWVSLASSHHVPSLNLSAIFEGTTS